MFHNYFVIAWRNLLRNKIYTMINILGLTIGVSSCLVLYLIVNYELSFNKKIKDYDRIFRIHSSFGGNRAVGNRGVPTAVAPTMRDKLSGVEYVVQGNEFEAKAKMQSPTGKQEFHNQHTLFTDPSYFNVFNSYEWIAGSPAVLSKPFQVVITESKAKLYFNTSDPAAVIGKEIVYMDSLSTNVAGVVKDLDFTTDLDFTDFISNESIRSSFVKQSVQLDNWTSTNGNTFTFFKVFAGTPRSKIENQLIILDQLHKKNQTGVGFKNNFKIDPLSNLHFNRGIGIFDHGREPAHLPTLYILIAVSIVLLLIAAINFINLETARAATRSKEVGVRKVMGSQRYHLVIQFLTESLIVTSVAVILAIPLAALSFIYFSEFIPAGLTIIYQEVIPFLLGVIVIVGLVAGLYPAWVLSSFKPVLALKTKNYLAISRSKSIPIRKALIVFQFTAAQVFICATLIFSSQIHYLLTKDLGFRSDAVIYFDAPWRENNLKKIVVLKNELAKISVVGDLCMSAEPPSFYGWSSSNFSFKRKDDVELIEAFRKFGDPNYLGFYGIKILAGRNLQPSDTVKEVIINETMMHQMGFTDPKEVIGQEVKAPYKKYPWPVVGVVQDFNTQSLHKRISPVILANEGENLSCFNLRISTGNQRGAQLEDALGKIQAAWKGVYPDYAFEYEFLDKTISDFYQSEQRNSKLVNTATALAIFISCLGLFGLASYTTIQRTKEIGIRKVLGASVSNIILLLSREFITLVIAGFFVAIPFGWYASNYWLETYPYHITIGSQIFMMTLVAALVIAVGSVSYQTFKTANSNPTDSLRSE